MKSGNYRDIELRSEETLSKGLSELAPCPPFTNIQYYAKADAISYEIFSREPALPKLTECPAIEIVRKSLGVKTFELKNLP